MANYYPLILAKNNATDSTQEERVKVAAKLFPSCDVTTLTTDILNPFKLVDMSYNKRLLRTLLPLKDSSTIDDIHDLRDLIWMPRIIDDWSKFKQVYKLDNTFAHELVQTDKLVMYSDNLTRLPYDTFYIDTEDVSDISYVHGIFVKVFPCDDFWHIIILACVDDYIMYSMYELLNFDETGIVNITINNQKVDIQKYTQDLSELENDGEFHLSYVKRLVYQMLLYLTCDKPDIKESEVTKKTYRPATTVKNKFSEIKMDDVGAVWGAVYRKNISQYKSTGEFSGRGAGISKRPHAIRAHWHRHWVGSGNNKELVLRWHEPTFTGSGIISAEVHKVQ